jgi:hypothetical protein
MTQPDREPSMGITAAALCIAVALVIGLGSGLVLGCTIMAAKHAIVHHGP